MGGLPAVPVAIQPFMWAGGLARGTAPAAAEQPAARAAGRTSAREDRSGASPHPAGAPSAGPEDSGGQRSEGQPSGGQRSGSQQADSRDASQNGSGIVAFRPRRPSRALIRDGHPAVRRIRAPARRTMAAPRPAGMQPERTASPAGRAQSGSPARDHGVRAPAGRGTARRGTAVPARAGRGMMLRATGGPTRPPSTSSRPARPCGSQAAGRPPESGIRPGTRPGRTASCAAGRWPG